MKLYKPKEYKLNSHCTFTMGYEEATDDEILAEADRIRAEQAQEAVDWSASAIIQGDEPPMEPVAGG